MKLSDIKGLNGESSPTLLYYTGNKYIAYLRGEHEYSVVTVGVDCRKGLSPENTVITYKKDDTTTIKPVDCNYVLYDGDIKISKLTSLYTANNNQWCLNHLDEKGSLSTLFFETEEEGKKAWTEIENLL